MTEAHESQITSHSSRSATPPAEFKRYVYEALM